MSATYTWDVFTTLDGYGSYDTESGDTQWGGYWSKQGPQYLSWRAELFGPRQRMIYGATTFREVAGIFDAGVDPNNLDEWNLRLRSMPATVISSTLEDTLGWPDAEIASGDAAEIIRRLKTTSDLPLRSQASLSLNWSLLNAGLVDFIQLSVFPVITGRTGTSPIYAGLQDFDLELVDSRTMDSRTLGLTYRPTKRDRAASA